MHFFFSFTDDEDLSTISDDFESMSIQSSTEDSQNEQSCSSRYILILFNYKHEILIKNLTLLYNIMRVPQNLRKSFTSLNRIDTTEYFY